METRRTTADAKKAGINVLRRLETRASITAPRSSGGTESSPELEVPGITRYSLARVGNRKIIGERRVLTAEYTVELSRTIPWEKLHQILEAPIDKYGAADREGSCDPGVLCKHNEGDSKTHLGTGNDAVDYAVWRL